MPLIFVQDLAHARIGQVRPTHDGADEIMFRGEAEQPARLLDAGAAGDHHGAIEPIAFQDGKAAREGRYSRVKCWWESMREKAGSDGGSL